MVLPFEQMARELVRAIRGRRSQVAFSRRLGYRSNVAYTWESGRRWPTAAETLRAASRCGIDVRAALGAFFRTPPPWLADTDPTTPEGVARLLRHELGTTPIAAVAARAGTNRFSVSRWLRGTSEPRLPDFLRLVEATSLRLVDLLAALVGPDGVPSARRVWERREAQRTAAIEEPWSQAVLRLLEIADRTPGEIATALDLEAGGVDRALALLERAGRVRRAGGRVRVASTEALDTRRTEETGRHLKGFWGRVGLERLAAGAPGQWSYNVVSVSRDQLRRLVELQQAHYRAVRAVVAEPEPPEVVALLHLQLLRLDR